MEKTDSVLSTLKENIELLKDIRYPNSKWHKLFNLPECSNTQLKSAFDALRCNNVTMDMLLAALPDHLGHLVKDPILARRVEVC